MALRTRSQNSAVTMKLEVTPGIYLAPSTSADMVEAAGGLVAPDNPQVKAADEALGAVVARLRKRGLNHPYMKTYVLARTTPLTRQRKTLPGFAQTFEKLTGNLEAFDVSKVRYEDIQRSAIMAAPAAG